MKFLRCRGVALGLLLVTSCAGPENTKDDSIVFDDHFVHEIEIEVDPAQLSELRLDNDARIACEFTFDGLRLDQVGIRLKGHLGSGREMDGKAQFSVKFNEFTRGQELHGLKKLTLNNEVQFPHFVSRRLGYAIWQEAGIPTPRTALAKVSFNGEYFGLYAIEEAYNKQFLKRHFEDPSGNLYEGSGDDLSDVGGIDLDTNEELDDRSDLQALAAALAAPDDRLLAEVGAQVDLEELYTYWAVERLVYHWDGYATLRQDEDCCSPNNYYAYRDPAQGRFVLLPRGADSLFRLAEADIAKPPSPRTVLAARLFALPEARARLAARIEEILSGAWDIAALDASLDQSAALLYEAFSPEGREEISLQELEGAIELTRDFVHRRPDIVFDRLALGF
jgi:spore coat protein CotH